MPRSRKKKLTKIESDTIERIAREHSGRIYSFMTSEDLHNEIWAICLMAIPEFNKDIGVPLEHFLRATVRNRMTNRFKEVTKSVRPPCTRCPFYDPGNSPGDCGKYGNKDAIDNDFGRSGCSKWQNYKLSVGSRNALMNTSLPIRDVQTSDNPLNTLVSKEFIGLVYKHIPKSYVHDLDIFLGGVNLPKNRFTKLVLAVKNVINKHNIDVGEYHASNS